MLQVYDDYMRQLEQENEEETRRYRIEHARKARKAREGFKALLSELEAKGELKRNSKWKELFPKFKNDERYLAMLGQHGSSALELWMDAVDDISEEVERAAAKIEREVGKDIKLETTLEDLEALIKAAHLDTQIDAKMRKEAHSLIHERLAQQAADEARRAERKRRHRMDDLRYALKKVRQIDVDMSYDDVGLGSGSARKQYTDNRPCRI
jgi:pre-mRNA-processing factor 40